jgi:DNA repair protein RadA/Sms
MALKTVHVCSNCGNTVRKWLGQCPVCGEWNTFVEEAVDDGRKSKSVSSHAGITAEHSSLFDVSAVTEQRYPTGIEELDRVLGGGIVKGSVVLIGGEPGAGKSTLLLQMCGSLADKARIFYFSGEESAHQIKLRADRMHIKSGSIEISSETDIERICGTIEAEKPDLAVIDSIQTMRLSELPSSPGSITQVRECTGMLQRTAKTTDIPIFIVGHVNKDGAIAGPKVMEHIVDTVLYFEDDRYLTYRVLRAAKNRFGSTNEIGLFDMQSDGLKSVKSASEMLIEGRSKDVSGSCVTCLVEGTRPMLVEVQSLVTKAAFGNARRTSSGFDYNRLNLILAVLEKRCGYSMSLLDVFVNIVGGITLNDNSSDLALCMSLISSVTDKVIGPDVIAFGEIGLGGEVRSVPNPVARVREAELLGFKKCILPSSCLSKINKNEYLMEFKGISSLKQIKDII